MTDYSNYRGWKLLIAIRKHGQSYYKQLPVRADNRTPALFIGHLEDSNNRYIYIKDRCHVLNQDYLSIFYLMNYRLVEFLYEEMNVVYLFERIKQ